jgi:hypothetical protein
MKTFIGTGIARQYFTAAAGNYFHSDDNLISVELFKINTNIFFNTFTTVN